MSSFILAPSAVTAEIVFTVVGQNLVRPSLRIVRKEGLPADPPGDFHGASVAGHRANGSSRGRCAIELSNPRVRGPRPELLGTTRGASLLPLLSLQPPTAACTHRAGRETLPSAQRWSLPV